MNCYFGGQDAMIPMDQVDAVRAALADAGDRHEVVVYDSGDHGFNCDQRASFQQAVVHSLLGRVTTAVEELQPRSLGCVGGVAKNQVLRGGLDDLCERHRLPMYRAPLPYCTDNAAMIASAACFNGLASAREAFDVEPGLALGKLPAA